MSGNLFDQGLMLMAVGMGTVFVFLTVLVAATTAMSRLIMRFAPQAVPAAKDEEEIAAIAAAIARHRRR
jgi:oxaloacetate decarboxylase gamma subunit